MYCINLLTDSDRICHFLSQEYPSGLEGVNTAVSDITNIMTNAAESTCKLRTPGRKPSLSDKKRKKAGNRWYDSDCRALKSTLRRLRRQLTGNPFSREIRTAFLSKSKEYRKLLKKKQVNLKMLWLIDSTP